MKIAQYTMRKSRIGHFDKGIRYMLLVDPEPQTADFQEHGV
jgi:hypothetical protein